MNKNIKRIVAMALAIGTISVATPATMKVYAEENEDTSLESLQLETSGGSNIKLYSDSDYDSDSRLDDDDTPEKDTYYAKTSANSVHVEISGPSSKYVKVFKGTSDNTKGKSISSDISISSDTTLTIRVYDDVPGSSVEYDDDNDDANIESEYKIKIDYTGSASNSASSEEDYGDIYLDKLSVEGDSISLSKSKTKYTYNVASDVDEVTIKAAPEYDEDTVTIDGYEVDEDNDKYKHDVSLDKGKNEFKVKIENEDGDYREYTLTINRGGTTSSTGTTDSDSDISNLKTNQWVQVNGRWQYNDVLGTPLKNTWFFDRNYGKNYYLQADGSMAVGWLSYNGGTYYLGTDGAMRTGWQLMGSWYYFRSDGKAGSGWIQDTNGKYYYLYSNGAMASNTTIGGYKLGADGAWIAK